MKKALGIVEHEILVERQLAEPDATTCVRTGRTRRRQFTAAYAHAARSGVWPDMATRASWSVPFQ